MFQRRTGTVGFKQGHNKFGRKISGGGPPPTFVNGGFETGTWDSWYRECHDLGCFDSIVSGSAPEGAYYARREILGPTGSAPLAFMRQYAQGGCAGGNYLHFWYRAIPRFPTASASLRVWILDGAGEWHEEILAYPVNWTEENRLMPDKLSTPPYRVEFAINGMSPFGDIYYDLDDIYFHA